MLKKNTDDERSVAYQGHPAVDVLITEVAVAADRFQLLDLRFQDHILMLQVADKAACLLQLTLKLRDK